MQDSYYIKNNIAGTIYNPHNNAEEVFKKLKETFSWFKKDSYIYGDTIIISSHDILQEPELISLIIPYNGSIPLFGKPCYATRKFCLSTKTSFLKSYELLNTRPSWMPEFCKPLFIGTNHEEFNRPYPALANTFTDYYFSGNSDQVEEYFDLPHNIGTYDTYYGATVVANEPVRIKQYVFNNTDSGYADWDVIYFLLNKKQQNTQ